jgi:hypothetical protein
VFTALYYWILRLKVAVIAIIARNVCSISVTTYVSYSVTYRSSRMQRRALYLTRNLLTLNLYLKIYNRDSVDTKTKLLLICLKVSLLSRPCISALAACRNSALYRCELSCLHVCGFAGSISLWSVFFYCRPLFRLVTKAEWNVISSEFCSNAAAYACFLAFLRCLAPVGRIFCVLNSAVKALEAVGRLLLIE